MHRFAFPTLVVFFAALLPVSRASAPATIAHRGFSHAYPDNSIPSINRAWEAGADMVELDVRITGDGILVLFHDAQVDKKYVRHMSYAQLQAATPDVHVPTLNDALRKLPEGGNLLLDLKDEGVEFLQLVLKETAAASVPGDTLMLQSRSLSVLKFLRARQPQIRLYYVTSLNREGTSQKPPDPHKLATLLNEHKLNGITAKGRQFITRPYIQAFHRRGLGFFVWTINQEDRIRHYRGLGVNGVITDRPDVGARLLNP